MYKRQARSGATDFAAIQQSLSWGTVMASFTIGSFGLDGLRGLTDSQIEERMNRFREAAKVE